MNAMIDSWVIFAADRGQVNEYAYRYDANADVIIQRVRNSDRTTQFYVVPCPEGVAWNGGEARAPFDVSALPWTAIPPEHPVYRRMEAAAESADKGS